MSEQVDLPGGGWVRFRHPDEVTERQRRPFVRLMMANGKDLADAESDEQGNPRLDMSALPNLQDMCEAAAVALVEAWSYDVPVTLDGVQDLPGPAYDRLVFGESQLRMASLMPSFGVNPDESSPTAASNV